MTEHAGSFLGDPIGTLVDGTRKLPALDDRAFAREWLLRVLQIELHRYSMEDAFIDVASPVFEEAMLALSELRTETDWLPEKLERYLVALRRTTEQPQLAYKLHDRSINVEGRDIRYVQRVAEGPQRFWISNTTAPEVPVLEESIGVPSECTSLLEAFSHQLNAWKATMGLTKLCFIEKEMGPVGAISMMSSLVTSTGLPACIYRETHWARQLSLTADRPTGTDRIAVVYDLLVTGAGISGAADIIRDRSGASTVAAIVLCGYGAKRETLRTQAGQELVLYALDWRQNVHGPAFESGSSRGPDEARSNRFVSRHQPGKTQPMDDPKQESSVPPGDYTRQTLPRISKGAERIVKAIRDSARNMQEPQVASVSRGLVTVKQEPISALKIRNDK